MKWSWQTSLRVASDWLWRLGDPTYPQPDIPQPESDGVSGLPIDRNGG